MNILLDTSVLSLTRSSAPSPEMVAWWKDQALESLYLSVISIHEIRQGIELAPSGKKREALEVWMNEFVLKAFEGRILSIDAAVADRSARLVVAAKKQGHTAELADALIAATAWVQGLRIATLNRKHFEKLSVEMLDF